MKTFTITVTVTEDKDGRLGSEHDFASDKDREIAREMVTGGNRQLATALLVEGIRREAFLEASILSGSNPEFIPEWQGSDDKGKRLTEQGLAGMTVAVLTKTLDKMSPLAAREIMEMLGGTKRAG